MRRTWGEFKISLFSWCVSYLTWVLGVWSLPEIEICIDCGYSSDGIDVYVDYDERGSGCHSSYWSWNYWWNTWMISVIQMMMENWGVFFGSDSVERKIWLRLNQMVWDHHLSSWHSNNQIWPALKMGAECMDRWSGDSNVPLFPGDVIPPEA